MFRKEALERLSSPERLDELLVVLRRRDWTLLGTVAVLVAAGLAWGFLGRIPLYAEGRAALVRPGAVASIDAHTAGVVVRLDLAPGQAVQPGQVVGRLDQPLLAEQVARQRARVAQLERHHQALRASQAAEHAAARSALDARRQRTTGRIAEARSAAAAAHETLLAAVGADRKRAAALEALVQAHVEAARRRAAAERELLAAGSSSERSVLDAEARSVSAAEALGDVEVRVVELVGTGVSAEVAYVDALQRTLDLEDALSALDVEAAGLTAREAELATAQALELGDARRALSGWEVELQRSSELRCEVAGTVLEVPVQPGDHVSAGQRLASVERDGVSGPLLALCYFDVKDGKLVLPGARVEVTPDMVERERFGGIVGRVRRVETFPASTAGAAALLGDPGLAAELTAEGRRVQIEVELQPAPANVSGVAWTLSGGPELTLSQGTTCQVRACVEEVPPLALVLPALRKLLHDERPEAR